ncbi:hypothetical protein KPL71_026027 [Citrus sinensis]|uniref:Uncharacterized protein n=1 Tax=Citrus sinensis TaxID=2711 RepID=A0ACB8HWN7_CITSI|nr:hypothetical protein KPL71_026027 [Citrus sinensis]
MVESYFQIEKLLEKLGSSAYEELLLFCGVKNDLQKLKETLTTVKSVVLDAEEKQIHNHRLRDWLGKLKDACYDAEDVLDEFEVEDLRRQVMKQRSIGRKFHNFFGSSNPIAFRFRMGHQIKKIRERFDEIAKLRGEFNLIERLDDHRRVVHKEREPTHSFVLSSDIIGRDKDREKIIELLMQTSDSESETVSVVPIVGLGGLGKTALAKLVYNDQRVEEHFELKIWICVSEDFDERQIMTKIIKSITDPEAWRKLKSLLLGGANGSKILVTTLAGRLLQSWARGELEQKESGILPILRLSYYQLPPHLKQCVAYCSIFPKDYPFDSFSLVQFWMAHGLLQSHNKNEELEDIGMRYLKELLSRSFFHDLTFGMLGMGMFFFKMHDLMHDLALLVAKDEFLVVNSDCQSIPKRVRHLSFAAANASRKDFSSLLSDLGRVRTIVFSTDDEKISQSFVESCISKSQFLRVLNLSESAIELEELPKDIRHLTSLRAFALTTKQKSLQESGIRSLGSLRCLTISGCGDLEHLFEEIDQLRVLRTLSIVCCPRLISLPPAIKYLSSLETLFLYKCESLDLNINMEMEGEGSNHDRKNTRPHLRRVVIGEITQLLELPQWLLQGSTDTLQNLLIIDCPNFMALPRSLKDLEALETLFILGCPKLSSLSEDMHHVTTLKSLTIGGCPALSERCKRPTGEDWPKIAHIPQVNLDGEMIKSSDN